jgi:hypothetical protein
MAFLNVLKTFKKLGQNLGRKDGATSMPDVRGTLQMRIFDGRSSGVALPPCLPSYYLRRSYELD